MGVLKLNSTFAFRFGPFLASSDAYTPSTGLTISSNAILLSKNGAAFAAKDDGNELTATEDTGGFYLCRLNSTDVNTPGTFKVYTRIATALPVWETFDVVSSEYYNAMFTAGGIPAASFADATWKRFGIVGYGTAQAADSTSFTLASSHVYGSNVFNGAVLYISGDTGFGQSAMVIGGAGSKVKVDSWVVTPAATAPYVIFASPAASVGAPATANVTQWNGDAVAAPTQAGVPEVDVTYIAGAIVNTASAQLGVNAVSFTAGALDTSAISAGFVTTLQAGLATSTEVSSGFAAQTAILSTMATAVLDVSTQADAILANLSTVAATLAALSTSVVTSTGVAEAVMNSTVDGAYTLRQMHRGYGAVLLGKASVSGTTKVFRDINDVKDRVTAGCDTTGTRSTLTIDLT
jgi:hypothetical protein